MCVLQDDTQEDQCIEPTDQCIEPTDEFIEPTDEFIDQEKSKTEENETIKKDLRKRKPRRDT